MKSGETVDFALLPASIETPSLIGSLVRLVPLSLDHVPGLLAAASEDPTLYAWTPVPQTRPALEAYVRVALSAQAQETMMPFAIIRGETVVGTTRFYGIERWAWPVGHAEHARRTPDVCDIGYTWLARSSVRTGVNTQAKRLLMEFAFGVWRVHRVGFRTDVRNAPSRAAIERLGARLDGCLRAERVARDGTVRDSAVYSIVATEWPDARARLRALEERPSP
jgi:RimJ/RimL family protein N-acetyltransferase